MKITEDCCDFPCAVDGELGHEKLKGCWENHLVGSCSALRWMNRKGLEKRKWPLLKACHGI